MTMVITLKDKFKMVGGEIPAFTLPNTNGESKGPEDFASKIMVIVLLRDIH